MNTYKLVMFTLVLFSATTAAAQQKSAPASQRPVVTKGYYAIGSNAQKLRTTSPLPTKAISPTSAAPVKGYFAIDKNRSKLPGQAGFIPLSTKRPVATKGYYNIGNNAEKLKN
jgi:hypothetical protein